MLCCLLLSNGMGLSDRQLEGAMEFRLDFARFVGLKLESAIPDAASYRVFRSRRERK